MEFCAETFAQAKAVVTWHEYGIAAAFEVGHVAHENFRSKAALVNRKSVAVLKRESVGFAAEYHAATQFFEERLPKHAKAVIQKAAWNADGLHVAIRRRKQQVKAFQKNLPSGIASLQVVHYRRYASMASKLSTKSEKHPVFLGIRGGALWPPLIRALLLLLLPRRTRNVIFAKS